MRDQYAKSRPARIGNAVRAQTLLLGMSRNDVRAAWGEPARVLSERTSDYGTSALVEYRRADGRYLLSFEGDQLRSWDKRPE
jgi:hypothetical protein